MGVRDGLRPSREKASDIIPIRVPDTGETSTDAPHVASGRGNRSRANDVERTGYSSR